MNSRKLINSVLLSLALSPALYADGGNPLTNMFVGVSGGYGYVGNTASSKSINTYQTLATSTYPLGVSLGTYLFKNQFFTLNYEYNALTEITLHNGLFEYNYEFNLGNVRPYVGLMGGFGYGIWSKSPTTGTSVTSGNITTSYIYGMDAGANYKLSNDFSLYAQGDVKITDFQTDVTNTTTTTFGQNIELNVGVGIKYTFGNLF